MSLFSKTALCAAFGVLMFGCGDTEPSSNGFKPVERNIPVFSEDLVVRPMELGKPISNSQVLTQPSITRTVAKTSKPIFQIDTEGKSALRINGIEQKLSSCELGENPNTRSFNEAVVTVQEVVTSGEGLVSYNTLKQFSVSDLNDGVIFISLKDKEEGSSLVLSLDLLQANCQSIDLEMFYALSLDPEGTQDSSSLVIIESLEFEEELRTATDSVEPLEYQRNSAIAFGVDGVQNDFLKVFRLSPELSCEGMTPAEVGEATANVRANLVSLGENNSREFIAADVTEKYESIDYSEYDKVYLELDNIPSKCSGVLVTTSYWVGTEMISPEPARVCNLEKDSTDPTVAWFPNLNSLPLVINSEELVIDKRGLCDSNGVLDPGAYQFEEVVGTETIEDPEGNVIERDVIEKTNYLELKTSGEDGDKTKDVFNLVINGEVLAEVSCAGPNKIRFNHNPGKLFCSDKLTDIKDIVGAPNEDEETPENEGAE